MINRQLLKPESIVVIGGSNNTHKPGGAIVRNLISGGYQGQLRVVNPKEEEIQGIKAYHDAKDIPDTELAILVVAARFCPDYVDMLAAEKGVRAFIIISAGFGEETQAGAALEQRILDTCERYGCALIGPNCIGMLNAWHHSVFTKPIPQLHPQGVDFISGSGATAVFILESAVIKGLQFRSVWSIGNGKQIGIEDVLQYMDENFDAMTSSPVKLLYIENIANPDKLLFHAASLIRKGCRIAAIKAGSSESGSRAASSHTGAIASSDSAVEALFRKAGIVRCFSREELTTVGCIFMAINQHPSANTQQLRNFAIVTHAGGPGVMLTDALSKGTPSTYWPQEPPNNSASPSTTAKTVLKASMPSSSSSGHLDLSRSMMPTKCFIRRYLNAGNPSSPSCPRCIQQKPKWKNFLAKAMSTSAMRSPLPLPSRKSCAHHNRHRQKWNSSVLTFPKSETSLNACLPHMKTAVIFYPIWYANCSRVQRFQWFPRWCRHL